MHLTQAHTICCVVTISRILQPGWLFAHGFLVSLRAVPQLPVEANGRTIFRGSVMSDG